MGAQTEERLAQYKKRYKDWEDPNGKEVVLPKSVVLIVLIVKTLEHSLQISIAISQATFSASAILRSACKKHKRDQWWYHTRKNVDYYRLIIFFLRGLCSCMKAKYLIEQAL